MNDTNTSPSAVNPSFDPGAVLEPTPESVGVDSKQIGTAPSQVEQKNAPSLEPAGTFVIAETPVISDQLEQKTVQSSSVVPQMTVETIPEEPPPEPLIKEQNTETANGVLQPVISPIDQQTQVPEKQNIVNTQKTGETKSTVYAPMPGGSAPPIMPPVYIPPKGGKMKWIILFFVFLFVVLAGLGFVFFRGNGVSLGNQQVNLVYWGLWEDEDIMRPVIQAFEQENPNIKVTYKKERQTEYRQRLESQIDQGNGPDVFRFHSTWIPMLKNQIEPIPSKTMSPDVFRSTFYPVAASDLLANTTLWGIPTMIDGLGLYINEDLFVSAAVSPPRDYNELISIVPKLTVKTGDQIQTSAIALGTTNNVEHFSDILALMMMQNGTNLIQPSRLEDQDAFVFYRKFATPSDPLYTWNEVQDNSISAFAQGRVAMIFAPSWRAFDIKNMNPSLKFKIVPVPQLPGITEAQKVSWASYWVEGVSSKSKYKNEAFMFLSYITSEKAVQKMYAEATNKRLFGPPYARVSLGEALKADPFVGAYITQAEYARSFPLASATFDTGLNKRMIQYMEDAMNSYIQGTTPASALEKMSQGFNQVLSDYGLVSAR